MFAFIHRRLTFTVLAVVCLALPVSAQTSRLEKVVVTLTRRNAYFVDGRRVEQSQIEPLLAARAHKNPELVAIIQCDRRVAYGRVADLMERVKTSGIQSTMLAPTAAGQTPSRRHSHR